MVLKLFKATCVILQTKYPREANIQKESRDVLLEGHDWGIGTLIGWQPSSLRGPSANPRNPKTLTNAAQKLESHLTDGEISHQWAVQLVNRG